MVKDRTNQIYTELLEYMKELYPKISGGTKYPNAEPKLPYMYFFQADSKTKDVTLSNTEESVDNLYQVEIYSDKGENSARDMANEAKRFMTARGYVCKTFRPIQNPTNVSRFVARYEGLEV